MEILVKRSKFQSLPVHKICLKAQNFFSLFQKISDPPLTLTDCARFNVTGRLAEGGRRVDACLDDACALRCGGPEPPLSSLPLVMSLLVLVLVRLVLPVATSLTEMVNEITLGHTNLIEEKNVA